jgi:hypothetical protein
MSACIPMVFTVVFLREMDQAAAAPSEVVEYTHKAKISSGGSRPTVLDVFNPLNAELNPNCHLLVLLEDLTFMGPCIVSIFQYTCISNKMQRYTVYLYLETALHVSSGTSTHH